MDDWTREGRDIFYKGRKIVYLEREFAKPTEADAMVYYIVKMLNEKNAKLEGIHAEWMDKE